MPAPTKAADVARLIVERYRPVEQVKVHKLLYYCQALSLVWFNAPLFDEPIEAWANGPVVPSFWRNHPYQGHLTSVPEGAPVADARALAVIDQITRTFGDLSGDQLSRQTHQEEPWKAARGALPHGARSDAPIDLNLMRIFYTQQWSA
jgi:uncharacterized phage-associated protein